MKFKPRKSLTKRFRVTRRKKIISRSAGQDHFNARESGKVTVNKRRDRQLARANLRILRRHVPAAR